MKKGISILLTLSVLFSLPACGGGGGGNNVSPSDNQSTPIESPYEIPEETCNEIQYTLHEYFHGFDDNSIISVSDCSGALDIKLCYDGMVLRVPFPDYANALSVQSQELAADYGEDIYKITVQFNGGPGKSVTWESHDGISGHLTDTYEETISISGQTIDDLVNRYGCMNWFYQLSESGESVAQPVEPDSVEDFPPIGPVGGEGISTVDVTLYLLSGLSGDSTSNIVYDSSANCIIYTLSADGFVESFLKAYADDSASSIERWEKTKSTFLSLDGSTRKLISQSCDTEVDTMFVVVDNEQEQQLKYIMMLQNGEIIYNLIDDFISLQAS